MKAWWSLLLSLALWPVLSYAQYTIVTVEVPFAGARNPEVTGLVGGDTIGIYLDAHGQPQGFLAFCGGPVVPLVNHILRAQSAAGIVGWRTAPTGHTTGFLLQDGTLTDLHVPLGPRNAVSVFSEALHVNSAGLTVGNYVGADGRGHGFRYDPSSQTYTTIDVPGAQATSLIFIAEDGQILAKAVMADTSVTYWLWDNGTVTALTLPSLPNVELVARSDDGRLVGNTDTTSFFFDGITIQPLEVPGAQRTRLFGIQGTIPYGRFTDAANLAHGFLALPTGTLAPCPVPPQPRKRDAPPKRAR